MTSPKSIDEILKAFNPHTWMMSSDAGKINSIEAQSQLRQLFEQAVDEAIGDDDGTASSKAERDVVRNQLKTEQRHRKAAVVERLFG